MTHAPLVGIVTPVFNGARFLAETMDCVQAQTYSNLVHVVLDNASDDATPDILRRYAQARIPVITARNTTTLPVNRNWNAALVLLPDATKYFRLMCADDLMHPTAIARKVAVAETDPAIAIVGCPWRAEGLCGEELPKDTTVFAGDDIARRYLRRETMVLSGTFTLIRRALVQRERPFYDSALLGIDAEANLRLVLRGKYGFVHEELVTWRRHEGSISSRTPHTALINMAEWLILLDRYGPSVLAPDEYRAARLAFRRHYLRRMLVMRWRHTQREVFAQHLSRLRQRGESVGLGDFADALVDWVRIAARGRRGEVGKILAER